MNKAALARAMSDRHPFTARRRADGVVLGNYFDGHRVLSDPALLGAVAEELYRQVARSDATVVAGEISAGTLLATAISLVSASSGCSLESRGVRKSAKGYGVEGHLTTPVPPGSRFALVDDVAGTGAAIERCLTVLHGGGHKVSGVYVMLDRGEEAAQVAARHAIPFFALFQLDELIALGTDRNFTSDLSS
jgi:orotate phosphoribosyltransferase